MLLLGHRDKEQILEFERVNSPLFSKRMRRRQNDHNFVTRDTMPNQDARLLGCGWLEANEPEIDFASLQRANLRGGRHIEKVYRDVWANGRESGESCRE